MSLSAPQLWSAWKDSSEIREMAEGWLTKPEREWSSDDDTLYGLLHREPDKLLSVIFGVMQLTDDQKILGGLAAGPLEDFLGVHGEAYLDIFHTLALEHRRLREVLDGFGKAPCPSECGIVLRFCSRGHLHDRMA